MRPFRTRSPITSTILDDLDASDDLDVATDVATRGVGRRRATSPIPVGPEGWVRALPQRSPSDASAVSRCRYHERDDAEAQIIRIAPKSERRQLGSLKAVNARRDPQLAAARLAEIQDAAREDRILMRDMPRHLPIATAAISGWGARESVVTAPVVRFDARQRRCSASAGSAPAIPLS